MCILLQKIQSSRASRTRHKKRINLLQHLLLLLHMQGNLLQKIRMWMLSWNQVQMNLRGASSRWISAVMNMKRRKKMAAQHRWFWQAWTPHSLCKQQLSQSKNHLETRKASPRTRTSSKTHLWNQFKMDWWRRDIRKSGAELISKQTWNKLRMEVTTVVLRLNQMTLPRKRPPSTITPGNSTP